MSPDPEPNEAAGTAPERGASSALPVFLSTEHWSLLGTRSMTWSEVMNRITIHLTVVSAFLVVLVLTAQRTGFGTPFRVMSIGFASVSLVMGTLTAIRVNMASQEDACLVAAMNRLRHAYVELTPEIEPYLTVSTHDDDRGVLMTYAVGQPRSLPLHVMGSTSFFLMTVNGIVAGTLGALVASAVEASTPIVAVAGVVTGLAYVAGHLAVGRRVFRGKPLNAHHPTPD
ncbi:hypothetical protein [Terrabacter sp. 2RAF25]|uniref:hypothetical protein n=1 Tax=Terrabacter sp. 2RAF25 TaxID=3232998 RepID=UPI003F993DE1